MKIGAEGRKTRTTMKAIAGWLSLVVASLFCTACVSAPMSPPDAGFAQRYHEYQALSRTGHASLLKRLCGGDRPYTQAIALSPFVPSDYYCRGLTWFKRGYNEKVIADFDRALLLDGRWAPAYLYRVLAHLNRGNTLLPAATTPPRSISTARTPGNNDAQRETTISSNASCICLSGLVSDAPLEIIFHRDHTASTVRNGRFGSV